MYPTSSKVSEWNRSEKFRFYSSLYEETTGEKLNRNKERLVENLIDEKRNNLVIVKEYC